MNKAFILTCAVLCLLFQQPAGATARVSTGVPGWGYDVDTANYVYLFSDRNDDYYMETAPGNIRRLKDGHVIITKNVIKRGISRKLYNEGSSFFSRRYSHMVYIFGFNGKDASTMLQYENDITFKHGEHKNNILRDDRGKIRLRRAHHGSTEYKLWTACRNQWLKANSTVTESKYMYKWLREES